MNSFRISTAAILSLLACACTDRPDPIADPAELALALAAIESQTGDKAAKLQAKIAGADRIAGTLSKVEPEKLDPKIAAVFLR